MSADDRARRSRIGRAGVEHREMGSTDFRVLGPLEIESDGTARSRSGAPKERALLLLFLLAGGGRSRRTGSSRSYGTAHHLPRRRSSSSSTSRISAQARAGGRSRRSAGYRAAIDPDVARCVRFGELAERPRGPGGRERPARGRSAESRARALARAGARRCRLPRLRARRGGPARGAAPRLRGRAARRAAHARRGRGRARRARPGSAQSIRIENGCAGSS